MTNDVRRNDLARVHLTDGREVHGFVTDVREETPGHKRVVLKEPGDGEVIDTSADRVEVADR